MMTFSDMIAQFLRMNFEADDVMFHVSKGQTGPCAERGVTHSEILALQEFEEEKILTFKQWNYKVIQGSHGTMFWFYK